MWLHPKELLGVGRGGDEWEGGSQGGVSGLDAMAVGGQASAQASGRPRLLALA